MTVSRVPAADAIRQLEAKTHLNAFQIRRVIGDDDFVNASLIAAIIKISEQAGIEAKQPKATKPRATNRFRARTGGTNDRVTISAAIDIVEGFARSEAL